MAVKGSIIIGPLAVSTVQVCGDVFLAASNCWRVRGRFPLTTTEAFWAHAGAVEGDIDVAEFVAWFRGGGFGGVDLGGARKAECSGSRG